MMNEDQATLCQRITTHPLDAPGAAVTFAGKLAHDNGWSHRHAQRVVAEYRRFLFLAVAAGHPNPGLRAKLGPESMVQETLLEAFRDRSAFRGSSEPELAAFLRAILVRNIRDAVRGLGRAKRDAQREVSLEALERASVRIEQLASQPASPERQVQRLEDLLRFIAALARLPEDERDVLELRHLQGLTLKEVAESLDRRYDAVRRLCSQGERRLRTLFTAPDPP